MKKLFVLFICATIVLGEVAILNIQATVKRAVDERAQALLQQARAAIGGEANINNVNNLVVVGKMTHKLKLPSGEERTIEGNLEMALQATNIYKMVRASHGGEPAVGNVRKIAVEDKEVVVIGKGESPEGIRVEGAPGEKKMVRAVRANHQGDLANYWLGLLLKTGGADAVYAGEGNVDGTACDIIEVTGAEGARAKVYLNKSTHLPQMISFRGANPVHKIMIRKNGEPANGKELKEVIIKTPEGIRTAEKGEAKIFVRKENGDVLVNGDAGTAQPFRVALEEVEIQIRFEDFRSVNGLLLPHKWTQTVNGQVNEVTTVDSYEINAPNLAERFKSKIEVVNK